MTVESVTYITDLNDSNPALDDPKAEGDDHIRNIKTGLNGTFPNFAGIAVTATEEQINNAAVDRLTVLASPQATTSGTSVTFSSIPSWVRKITIMLDNVSTGTDGNDAYSLKLGDSGGIESTGYNSGYTHITSSGVSFVRSTAYFGVGWTNEAADVTSGCFTLALLDSSTNTWAIHGSSYSDGTTDRVFNTGGSKSLSATLDRIEIASSQGYTFDAGKINIKYEL